jgi:hypothetical protein
MEENPSWEAYSHLAAQAISLPYGTR